jgi:hypothetical protein
MNTLRLRDVQEVWGSILPGVLKAREKGGGDWTPEELYERCRDGMSFLWMADDGAFCVLELDRNSRTNELEVLVWVGYSPGRIPLSCYMDQVRAIARAAGAVRLRMQSARPGWARDPTWRAVAVEYVSEV